MILACPYHDPGGRYNQAFQRQLATLRSAVDAICLSVVAPTSEKNAGFVRYLEEQGCAVVINAPNTPIGEHSREALRLALEHGPADRTVFFGFLGRILFALETKWRTSFLQDLQTHRACECMVFERSQAAWRTHPSNYREIEQMVSRMFQLLCGRFIELMPCALILSGSAAATVLGQSTSPSYEIWAEWILLALKNGIPVTTSQVDWLAYQHPHWERIAPDILKQERETSVEETIKRIRMNLPVALLLTEDRFGNLRKARQHAGEDRT